LAEQLSVDAWLAEDRAHFIQLASHRPARPQSDERLDAGMPVSLLSHGLGIMMDESIGSNAIATSMRAAGSDVRVF
jgi:hypothetical protein